MWRISLALALLLAACATAPPPAPLPAEPPPSPAAAPEAAPAPPATCTAFAAPGVLRRPVVARTVDAGMGRWLAGGVTVDPDLRKGRFRGWIIRRLYPNDVCYREVDLRPGDVVLKINGKSLERPEEANDLFKSVATAPALVIEFVRDGAPMKLTFQFGDQ